MLLPPERHSCSWLSSMYQFIYRSAAMQHTLIAGQGSTVSSAAHHAAQGAGVSPAAARCCTSEFLCKRQGAAALLHGTAQLCSVKLLHGTAQLCSVKNW